MLKFVGALLFLSCVYAEGEKAIVRLDGFGTGAFGIVTFTQISQGVKVEGFVSGLTPGEHGFHVHGLGDLSKGCASAGGHFNPYNKNHGAPSDKIRHVGDLGNILADANGNATILMTDHLISLKGETNIIGRAVVVHAGKDDLGQGGNNDSLTTGNAGARAACGVIGTLTQSSQGMSSLSINAFVGLLAMAVTSLYNKFST